MKTKSAILSITICLIAFNFCGTSRGADPVQLPSPRMEGGKPLMQVLKERRTTRAFADRKVSPETLSNLLWAAFGINRPDGRRTAPSARNWQEIDIYVSTADGFYLWSPVKNILIPVLTRDARALTGTQDHAASAPVSLVYVADYSKVTGGGTDREVLVGADTGFISQNVYLFCASEGLATVVRASIDRDALARELKLRPDQKIILAQSVGYPREEK